MWVPILLLLSLGIVVIYTSNTTLAIQQFIFSLIGLTLFFFLRIFDYRAIKPLIVTFYIFILICLVVTLVLGIESRGSIRWISVGPFNFQPSEFAKPILILALAHFWSQNLPTWKNILKSFAIFLPIGLMIFRQPDLGTTLTVGMIWFIMLLAASPHILKIALIVLVSIIITPLSWLLMQSYQKQRILSFFSPQQDPQGIGFHVIQSTIAVGSGQLIGRGLGRGTQSRLQFLPEFRTDFIFAFIAEELGFIGSLIVLCLYGTIFFLCYKILTNIGDRFGELIIMGVIGMLFFQTSVNIGMNIGLLPITGITLPLLSYGGSSIVTTLISLGLVASVAKFGLKKKEVTTFGLDD